MNFSLRYFAVFIPNTNRFVTLILNFFNCLLRYYSQKRVSMGCINVYECP